MLTTSPESGSIIPTVAVLLLFDWKNSSIFSSWAFLAACFAFDGVETSSCIRFIPGTSFTGWSRVGWIF